MTVEVQQLLLSGESETVEFKQSLGELHEIIATAGAFANGTGGTIVIGVAPSGKVLGVDIGKDTLEALANSVQQQTDPKLFPTISTVAVEGRTLIVVHVATNSFKPVLVQGRGYKRVGRSNHVLSSNEWTRLFFTNKGASWDAGAVADATFDDIDENALRHFLRRAKQERNMAIALDTPLAEALAKLELLYEGKPNRAAILLFGKRPQRFFYPAELRCARFKGAEPIHFLDMKVMAGDIIAQVPAAMEFIQRHISMAAEIVATQVERIDRWEYPLEALREAIINAVCHRDYCDSGNVQVRIFDDRIEVWSPGLLPEGITIPDLYRTHSLRPRNHRIAHAFFLINYIEQWGTGTLRMIELCKAEGLPEPEYDERSGAVVVSFKRRKPTRKYHDAPEQSQRQKQALELVRQQGRLTARDYAKLLGVSKRTANCDLMALVERGLLQQGGKGKTLYFELK